MSCHNPPIHIPIQHQFQEDMNMQLMYQNLSLVQLLLHDEWIRRGWVFPTYPVYPVTHEGANYQCNNEMRTRNNNNDNNKNNENSNTNEDNAHESKKSTDRKHPTYTNEWINTGKFFTNVRNKGKEKVKDNEKLAKKIVKIGTTY